MSQEQKFSDEFLNAFVDDQLTPEEKGRAYASINSDEALNRQVCELRTMRDLVQLAYKDLPAPAVASPRGRRGLRLRANLAAGFIFAFGVALGWVLHQSATAPINEARVVVPSDPVSAPAAPETPPMKVAHIEKVPPATKATRSITTPQPREMAQTPAVPTALSINNDMPITGEQIKVLIHVNSNDTAHLKQALIEIEDLLRHYRVSSQRAQVEVVINGDGLALVRADVSPFADRIRALQAAYDNLTFAACQNTIERLKRDKGITARLLPGVIVIDSGVAQIMRRQQQGWAYIQV